MIRAYSKSAAHVYIFLLHVLKKNQCTKADLQPSFQCQCFQPLSLFPHGCSLIVLCSFLGRESTQRSKVGNGDMAVNRGKKKNEGNYIAQIPHPCLELFVVQRVWSWLGAGWDGGWDEGSRGLEGGWWLSCVPSAWRKQRLLSPGLRPFIWRLSSDRSLGLSSSESSALQHAVCLSETFAEISSNAKPVLCLKCAPPRGCSYLPRGVPTVKTWDRPMGDL